MPSRNQVGQVPVPWQGLRGDLHARHIGPEACSLAKNVLVYDGTLRPRPAMSHSHSYMTTLTDTESTPAGNTEFDHNAQAYATCAFTYQTGDLVGFELCENGSHGLKIYALTNGNFEISDVGTGSQMLYTESSVFTGAVAYTFKVYLDTTSKTIRVLVNDVEKYAGFYLYCPADTTGKIVHTLNPNDIEIRTYASGVSARPLGVVQWNAETEKNSLVVMTGAGWFHYIPSTGTWVDITGSNPLTGSPEALGVFRTFEKGNATYLIGCNGSDPPKYWDGETATYTDFASSALASRVPIVSANRMVLAGAGTDHLIVDVSAFNDFTTGYGTVQQTLLGDTPGEIIAGLEINALRHVIYKTDAIYNGIAQAEFYGVAAPFRYEAAATDVPGPVSPLAVLRLPDGTQCYLGEDGGLYVFDGVRPREMGRHIRFHVQETWDYNLRRQSWMTFDQHRKLLWIWYPHSTGGMQKGIVCSVDQAIPGLGWPMWLAELPSGWEATAGRTISTVAAETIGDGSGDLIGDSGDSIGSGQTLVPKETIFDKSGVFYTQKWDDGTYLDGYAKLSVDCITGYSSFNAPDKFKTVHEVEHLVELITSQSLAFQLKSTNYGEDVTTSAGATVVSTTKPRTSSFRQAGKWFALRLYSVTIDRLFKWDGAGIFYRLRGRR